MAERYTPPMLADFPFKVIFLFGARNSAPPQDKAYSRERECGEKAQERNRPGYIGGKTFRLQSYFDLFLLGLQGRSS